jgi:hypothetical protein
MNREAAMKRYNLLKSQRHLAEYIDYDPSFLRRLSDKDLIYLVEFLTKMYNDADQHARHMDMQVMSDDIVSANELDERTMDYTDTAYLIKFVRPTTQ